jgi:GT2 family glycosyltransferase
MPSVWIVILNWKNGPDTVECLQSILETDDTGVDGVVVCDNNSADGSVPLILQWAQGQGVALSEFSWRGEQFAAVSATPQPSGQVQPDFVLVQTGTNLGFAGGNNVGIRYIQQSSKEWSHILLLNNDALLTPGAVSHMLARFEASPIGMCGATVIYHHTPSKVQAFAGARFQPWLARAVHLGGQTSAQAPRDAAEVESHLDYPLGAALMISRACLEDIGLMEERYFLYFEEIDWAVRAKRAGYRLGYAPGSEILHKEGGTIGSNSDAARRSLLSEYYLVRSALAFTRKFYPYLMPTVIAYNLLKTLRAGLRFDGPRVSVRMRAMLGMRYLD